MHISPFSMPGRGCRRFPAALLLAALAVFANLPAAAATLILGPRGVQALVAQQLFNSAGRWYLIDDGGVCFTYLDKPRTRLENDRLVLDAHLTSRLGQRIGDTCAGADLASNVTVSGRLRGTDRKLVLEDIRIGHVDDEATRNALALALQIAPQAMPHSAAIDVFDLVRKQVLSAGGIVARLDQFRIASISTRPDAVVIQFDLSLSTP